MSNCWLKGGKCMERAPLDYYGFVYRITASNSEELPEEMRGKIYIGKKAFMYNRKKKLSKKRKVGTRKRVETVKIDSKWLGYYGSNKQLIQDVIDFGEHNFKREVLHLCYGKAQLSYYEVKEQIEHKVLMVNSYNGWISCRIFKTRLSVNLEMLD